MKKNREAGNLHLAKERETKDERQKTRKLKEAERKIPDWPTITSFFSLKFISILKKKKNTPIKKKMNGNMRFGVPPC